MQTKASSALESIANMVVGYGAAVASQMALFPVFGIEATITTHLGIGAWFTVVSVVRSYTVRRLFARWEGNS